MEMIEHHRTEEGKGMGVAMTVCPFCGMGCGLVLLGRSAFPLDNHPVSQGGLFLRGWASGELLFSPLRVRYGLVRDSNGTQRPLSVEDALEIARRQLKDLCQRYGPEKIGVLGSARLTTEEIGLLKQLSDAIGTPHRDSFQRMGYLPFPAKGLETIEEASDVTVLATDCAHRHPQAHRRLVRAIYKNHKVRFVDSRRLPLSQFPDYADYVEALPGSELDRLPNSCIGLTVLSSEIALEGQGSRAWMALDRQRTVFLTDYVNQRGLVESGFYPPADGMGAFEILQAASEGKLKALIVFADDPSEFFPEQTKQAFARVEWSLVVDSLLTPTARLAHLVLPGALLWEKDGTVTNTEGRVQQVGPVQEPLAGWTEGQIIACLLEEWADAGNGITPGPLPYPDGGISPDPPDESYPMVLTLDSGTFWNRHIFSQASVTVWREARNERADFPNGYVSLNPEDARKLGVRPFSDALIEAREGTLRLRVKVDQRPARGVALLPMSLWEAAGTALKSLIVDPALKIPIFRPTPVRIRPAP
ncbi:MAG: molybdopterin-dependent oxidoreductase [Armatimonadetes bacterium]|nr:molybdopterin-dependent oxidoreductase [Armatimonadota bacterium]